MEKFIEKPIIIIILLAVVCWYLFFYQLGALALTDPDETFYGQTAKEMLNRNEWSTPHLYGKPHFEKPIFFYWTVILSYKIFGVNEFAARFPSAVFGLIGVIAMYFLGTLLFNRRIGILAALILAASVEYVILARGCLTDMQLSVFILLGMLFFLYGYKRDECCYYVASALAFALAVLTKGPVGLLLPGIAILAYLTITREFKVLLKRETLFAMVAFIVVTLPWYISMYKLHGQYFIDEFFGFRNLNRFLVPEHKIGSQFYFYVPVLFADLFPWSVFLPIGLWRAFKALRSQDEALKKNILFLLLWFAVIFIFFSISGTKLVTYIAPSFAPLAIIIALMWDGLISDKSEFKAEKGMKVLFYLLILIGIGGIIGLNIVLHRKYSEVLLGVNIACLILLAGFVLSLSAFVKRRFMLSFGIIVAAVIIFLYPLSKLVLPKIEPHETGKHIAGELKKLMKPQERLGAESHYRAGLAFYTDKFPIDLDRHHDLVTFLSSNERVWCVLKEKNHRHLYELDTQPLYMRPSYVVFQEGKKTIITNLEPEDGKYLIKRERKQGG